MKILNIGSYVVGWAKRSPATFLLHAALVVILCGALITCFSARHGQITIYAEAATNHAQDGDDFFELPFSMRLDKTVIDYYPASTAPKGYSCEVVVGHGDGSEQVATISMENMLIVNHYRFTLVSIGHDSATLTVNHDPCGIFFTYLGYGMLFVAMILYFFQPRSGFRFLLRSLSKANATAVAALALICSPVAAIGNDAVRNVIPDNVARTFGKIYVYWDDRPAPMQTMSRAILSQVHGSDTFEGQTADQVILGWIVYYDSWKDVPLIKVKSQRVRDIIGVSGKYASLMDFFDAKGYKLQPLLDTEAGDNDISRVDRSVQLMASVAMGSIMRIYPYMSANHRMEWLSWTDRRPSQMSAEQWVMIETSMRDVVTSIIKGNANKARNGLLEIREYQLDTTRAAGTELSQARFKAEIFYNRISSMPLLAAMITAAAILAALVAYSAKSRKWRAIAKIFALAVMAVAAAWLLCLIILRWHIAGHWPLTNGPESMQVMALMSICVGAACARKYFEATLMSMIVAGLSLAVAAMSGGANVISPLIPVLNNPLLSVHVLVIMMAYALLTIIMLLSVYALAGCRRDASARHRAMQLSLAMLYPAVFLLCAGIFIGAIWANQSWGRYWGWDPKETWALITMLVYSVPLHWSRIRAFRNDKTLAVYLALSFLTVIITYFGVNFVLGGMHSYS